MRVAMMTREYPPEVYGGAGVHVTELVGQLRKLCDVDVYCMGAPRHGVFVAQGNVLALRTADGKTLWHAGQGQGMQSSPITYELDGRQYVLTSGGGVLFAWALPEK